MMTVFGKFAKLENLRNRLWTKACLFDGIPTDTKLVVFSDANPYADPAGRATMLYLRTMRDGFAQTDAPTVYRHHRPLLVNFQPSPK